MPAFVPAEKQPHELARDKDRLLRPIVRACLYELAILHNYVPGGDGDGHGARGKGYYSLQTSTC
jgi:hypothetical protein